MNAVLVFEHCFDHLAEDVVGEVVGLQAQLEEPGMGRIVVVILGFLARIFNGLNLDIQTETAENVLSVPIQAVTTRSDSTGKSVSTRIDKDRNQKDGEAFEEAPTEINEYVFLYKDGTADMVAVESGIQDNTNIQILEGLEEGQEIIIGPYRAVSRSLKNGDPVEKVSKEKLFEED